LSNILQNKSPLILIVDDNSNNLNVLGNIFLKENYQVSIASKGFNAIQIAKNRTPDLILLDISMPEMDGFEVCKILKSDALTAHIPILFLTARTNITDIVQGFALGAVDYITKPFESAELLARVKTHLSLKFAQQQIIKQNVELTELNQKLQEINQTKDRLLTIIAHDLRNPFGVLMNLSELLVSEMESGELTQILMYAKLINTSAKTGFDLLNNLLEWERFKSGNINPENIDFDVNSMINRVLEAVNLLVHNKNLTIINTLNSELYVNSDVNFIETIIRNFALNAVKFTPTNGNIKINATLQSGNLLLSVSDTGIGMPEKVKNELFIPSEKKMRTGTNNERGTGLGLMICSELAKLLKANIIVESEEHKGSVFYLQVPIN